VRVKHHEGPGLIHGYFGMGDASDVARAEAQRARADFKALLMRGA
ncbi:alpha/beta hydrolase, partial [Bradyrhizobium sp. SHOUNA76]|nr:alpha/beta hydrolase [Bradyrhizobium sp. SHOUNA76]